MDGEGCILVEQNHCSVWLVTRKTQSGSMKGDVDGNGSVQAEDALLVLKYVAHMVNLSEEKQAVADVDGNSKIAAEDALMILKYVAHMVSEL